MHRRTWFSILAVLSVVPTLSAHAASRRGHAEEDEMWGDEGEGLMRREAGGGGEGNAVARPHLERRIIAELGVSPP